MRKVFIQEGDVTVFGYNGRIYYEKTYYKNAACVGTVLLSISLDMDDSKIECHSNSKHTIPDEWLYKMKNIRTVLHSKKTGILRDIVRNSNCKYYKLNNVFGTSVEFILDIVKSSEAGNIKTKVVYDYRSVNLNQDFEWVVSDYVLMKKRAKDKRSGIYTLKGTKFKAGYMGVRDLKDFIQAV